jgi:putative hydrolase of the HAD superfamily
MHNDQPHNDQMHNDQADNEQRIDPATEPASDPATSSEADRARGETHADAPDRAPAIEALTPDEKEAFLARARAQGRSLTSAEQYALFGPPPKPAAPAQPQPDVDEMEAAALDDLQLTHLTQNFFPELGEPAALPPFRLLRGVILDFDDTLAELAQPQATLWEAGAKAAEAYMRSTGMDLPDDFWTNIIEARRFSEEKSEEEQEEHLADDAMSFLLQFFGYPASRMDPDVLRRAVDLFYAPEMSAWRLRAGAAELLAQLRAAGYFVGVIANYNCDRVFQRAVDYLGIRPYLHLCLCSASVEFRKPDPKLYEIALAQWDLLPYEVVVVGDSLAHDIAGGIELGALTVWTQPRANPQVAFANDQLRAQVQPDAAVTELAELFPLITTWATP